MKKIADTGYSVFKVKNMILIVAFTAFTLACSSSFAQQKPWASPKEAQVIKNPFAGNSSTLAEGKKLYVTNCAPCHGEKGRGDGPAAQALVPKPADHSSALVQSETDGSLFWKLTQGRNPMPAYGKILTEQQRWELVNYIRTLSKTAKK